MKRTQSRAMFLLLGPAIAAASICAALKEATAGDVPKKDEPVVAAGAAHATCALVYGTPEYAAAMAARTTGPILLKPGVHLFPDEYLIEHVQGVARKVNVPQRDARLGNPVVTAKEDHCYQPFFSVSRSPETGTFRIWYGVWPEDTSASASHVAYMESNDGVHWKRPTRILKDPATIQFGSEVLDEGPDCPDASKRYVYSWWYGGGTRIAVSPDGLDFTPISADVVLPHNHDITNLWRDPIRNRYVATVSEYLQPDNMTEKRRTTFQAVSDDLLHWSPKWMVLAADNRYDKDVLQFYAMNGYLARGELVIGLVKNLHDDWKAEGCADSTFGIGSTSLAWTHDGETWVRDREVFFGPDPKPGAWDHAHAWIDEQVPVGDDVYLYYGGYQWGHKHGRQGERQIGLVKMKRDRYVAREAGEQVGTLRTVPMRLAGSALTVNAIVDGEMDVRLIDPQGRSLPGFDWVRLEGDQLDHPVVFGNDVASLHEQPVRLEFRFRNARLFGFDLCSPK